MQGKFLGAGSVTLLIHFYSNYNFSAFLILFEDFFFFSKHLRPGLIFYFSAVPFK